MIRASILCHLVALFGAICTATFADALKATVTAVNGTVQVRSGEDQKWDWVKIGMELGEGAEFRTGPKSAVQFKIPPDQTVTLDRLGVIKLLQAAQDAGSKKVTTDLGMKYGRTAYKIEEGGVEHDSTIRSPGSTLAVRGSEVIHQHDALSSFAAGEGHLRFFSKLQRESIAFGDSGVKAKVTTDRMQAGANARQDSTTDAKGTFAGRTGVELAQNEKLPEVGGEDLRERQELKGVDLGAFASSAFVGVQPNSLLFDLFFDPSNTVELSIIDPKGQKLSSLTAQNTATPDQTGINLTDSIGDPGHASIIFGRIAGNTSLHFVPGDYQIDISLLGGTGGFVAFVGLQDIGGSVTVLSPVPNPDGQALDISGPTTLHTTVTAPPNVD